MRKTRLLGMYKAEDMATRRRPLEATIAGYKPQLFPCPYIPSTGGVDCSLNAYCEGSSVDDMLCPEKALWEARRSLSRLDMLPLLTQIFADPDLATSNNFLNREVIYSHL